MQRIYIFIIIAVIILAAYYSNSIKELFKPTDRRSERSSFEQRSSKGDDSYDQLGIELYRITARLTDLQGKAKLLKIAKENKKWFKEGDFSKLDELIKVTEEDLKEAEKEYYKTRKAYAKRTVQKMLEEFSKKQ